MWFDETRAPEYAAWLLDECRKNGWHPELYRVDPPVSQIVNDALRQSADLVALRPKLSELPAGLRWIPLAVTVPEVLLLAETLA